ncbi:MAG: tetratricopeptide repeat protein [Anaerolineales bacterium]
MHRNILRVAPVLLLILLAVFAPVIISGYSELEKARTASSYTEAAQHYQLAVRRIPWRADLHELAGHSFYYAKEYIKADAAYQKALQSNALSAAGWVAWGDVNYLNNDPQRAAEIWEQAAEQKVPSDDLYSRLAQIYQENGEYSRAADSLQRYVSIHAEDASAHYRLGLLLTLSDLKNASSELLTASQLDPQFDSAVQTLRTALNLAALNGSPSERLIILGRGLGLVNEWELAHEAFAQAARLDERNADALAWLAEARQQTGQVGVESSLESALRLNPNSSTVRGLRGLYFQRTNNFRQALEEFQHAAAFEPDNPAWQVSIGEAHSKLGDLILALEAYKSATALAPGDENYWRLLAMFCAQNGVNIKDVGVPAAQKVVVLSEDDATALDLLGWLLLLDARYEDAEKILARALELDPQNASAHVHLALVYLQKENRNPAYDHLLSARDLGSVEAEALLSQYFP